MNLFTIFMSSFGSLHPTLRNAAHRPPFWLMQSGELSACLSVPSNDEGGA
jgi:hypothetical protein